MADASTFKEWILEAIDQLRKRKARPDLDGICHMLERRHGVGFAQVQQHLEILVQTDVVIKVDYRGSTSYRNATKWIKTVGRKTIGQVLDPTVVSVALGQALCKLKNEGVQRNMNSLAGEGKFDCLVCEESFRSLGEWLTHTKTHLGDKPYVCSTCEDRFSDVEVLKVHKRFHGAEQIERGRSKWKGFRCGVCKRTITNKGALTVHMKSHSRFGEKKYLTCNVSNRFQCVLCGKVLCSQFSLQYHRMTHTGEKPYKCVYCPKRFRSKSYMLAHKRTHERVIT